MKCNVDHHQCCRLLPRVRISLPLRHLSIGEMEWDPMTVNVTIEAHKWAHQLVREFVCRSTMICAFDLFYCFICPNLHDNTVSNRPYSMGALVMALHAKEPFHLPYLIVPWVKETIRLNVHTRLRWDEDNSRRKMRVPRKKKKKKNSRPEKGRQNGGSVNYCCKASV